MAFRGLQDLPGLGHCKSMIVAERIAVPGEALLGDLWNELCNDHFEIFFAPIGELFRNGVRSEKRRYDSHRPLCA